MKDLYLVLLAGLLGVLLLGLGIGVYLASKETQRSGNLYLSELSEPVEVHYDTWGVPHLYAQNEEDAALALGYVHAQDRLFQIDLVRRLGAGRLAEIFGPTLLDTDRFFRTLGIKQYATRFVQNLRQRGDPQFLKVAERYIAGVNVFIETGLTPIEYDLLGLSPEPLALEDLGHVVGYMAFSFARAFTTEPVVDHISRSYGPAYLEEFTLNTTHSEVTPALSPPPAPSMASLARFVSELEIPLLPTGLLEGSNAWVVGGSHTTTGAPILANDPHIGFGLPDVWYEAHVSTPEYEVYGHHLAGLPLPVIGFTKDFAWGITMLENDDIDFYREQVNPKNPNEVLYKGKWVPLRTREEAIYLPDGSKEVLLVQETPHGPVVNQITEHLGDADEQPISMLWTFLDPGNTSLEGFFKLSHARSFEEFQEGVSLHGSPGLNILYAHRDGTIAKWAAARLPIRPAHVNPQKILDGGSGKDEPLGFHPFEKNPRVINPKSGVIISANNPYAPSPGTPPVPGYYSAPDRIERLRELLTSGDEPFDPHSLSRIQTDVTKTRPLKLIPILTDALEAPIKGWNHQAVGDAALKRLQSWDGQYQIESSAPTIWERFYFFTLKGIYEDELTEDLFPAFIKTAFPGSSFFAVAQNASSPWWDNQTTPTVETASHILRSAWRDAIESLINQFGLRINWWTWGEVHTLEFNHPFNRTLLKSFFNVGPFPANGSRETISHFGFPLRENSHRVTSGPSTRRIIPLGALDQALGVSPLGQSANRMDTHYNDQTPLFLNDDYRRVLFDRQSIQSEKSSTLMLLPGEDPT